MIWLVVLYGVLALIREWCVVGYHVSVYTGKALSASAHGAVTDCMDSFVFVVVMVRIATGKGILSSAIPLAVYILGGAIGTFIGVKKVKR